MKSIWFFSVWDLRNPGQLYTVLDREVDTNQRIYFDTVGTNYVASGSTDGSVTFWDLSSVSEDQDTSVSTSLKVKVKLRQKVHDDCVNGISLHPYYSLAALTSGQRRLQQQTILDSSEEESGSDSSESVPCDNSLTLVQINRAEN